MGTLLLILFVFLVSTLWAAPGFTARSAPAGIMLEEGQNAKIAFAADPDVSIWELETQPPGREVDVIPQTTQHNTAYETFAFGVLQRMSSTDLKFGYDPNFQSQISALLGINTEITVHWPDGSRLAFWGGVNSIQFDRMTKGQMPTGTLRIQPTNRDNSGAEQAPVYSNVAGT